MPASIQGVVAVLGMWSHLFSFIPQEPFLRAQIAIVKSCLPREKKLEWIVPSATMKPVSDTQGSPRSL
jgi:hypothetical protein